MKKIDEYLLGNKFSGVVSITQQNKVMYEQAFGWSDREKSIKNTPQTKFFVGSMISKPITAICILQLVEKGLLTLEQSLEEFFPYYRGKGITLHHLLNHTSGIVNYLMLRKKLKWEQAYTPEQLLHIVEQEELSFSPGKKAAYCNTGFLMLGLIIEKVTGLEYAQYVKKHIFLPADMTDSSFIREEIEGYALNYVNNKKGPVVDPSLLFACGEVVTTVSDVHKFDRALKTNTLLTNESIRLMEKPSYQGRFITFGYSWFLKNLMGRQSTSHGGSHPGGYTSHLERYMDEDLTIVVLSNNLVGYKKLMIKDMGGTFISREVASILFEHKLPFWQKVV
ncbi:serine hydrolase domain-containing protein [Bacillus sp. AK128]